MPSPRRLTTLSLVFALGAGCAVYRSEPLPRAGPREPDAKAIAALGPAAAALPDPIRRADLDARDGLDPDELAALAVLLNPGLIAARTALGESQADVRIERELPNPTIGASRARPTGSGSSGLSTAVELSAALDTQRLVTLAARLRRARAERGSASLDLAWREWEVGQAARLEATRLGYLQDRRALLDEELERAGETRDLLERARAAGDATDADVAVQLASLEGTRRTAFELEREESKSRAALLTLLGAPHLSLVLAPQGAPDESRAESAPWTEVPLEACVARRLDLSALRRSYEAQEARVLEAVLSQLPALSIGVRRSRDETSLRFFGGFVDVSLPIFNQHAGEVARERATRSRLRDEYAARMAALSATLASLDDLLEVVSRQLPVARTTVAELAAIEMPLRAAARRGDVDWSSYEAARTSLVQQRLEVASLEQARSEAEIGLESACGGSPADRPAASRLEGTT